MKCEGCGNTEALHIRVSYHEGEKQEQCDICGNLGRFDSTDAYCPIGGYFDENLADAQHRKGQYVHSKRHKAALLKRLNRVEAGGQRNPVTGHVTPYIKDPDRRRRYMMDNFGGNG